MSTNDMLAPIVRALVGMPQKRLGVIFDIVNKIGGADGELWRSCIAGVLRKGIEFIIQETAVLKPEASITFPARNKPIDPNEFFNRPNVDCSESFRKRILSVLKLVASTPKRIYGVGCLKKSTDDREIRLNLPKRHLGNWEDAASLIEMYPNGKAGHYFLYLEGVGGEVFAVRVRWSFASHQWVVDAWRLGEAGYWSAGSRVLCPSNTAL